MEAFHVMTALHAFHCEIWRRAHTGDELPLSHLFDFACTAYCIYCMVVVTLSDSISGKQTWFCRADTSRKGSSICSTQLTFWVTHTAFHHNRILFYATNLPVEATNGSFPPSGRQIFAQTAFKCSLPMSLKCAIHKRP